MTCPTCDALRNDPQNRRLHAALNDIARQVKWHGQTLTAGVWKRLCVAAWLREEGERPIMVPALDGVGVDVIYERTSRLSKKRTASLIDWVHAFGAENSVEWTDPDYQSQMREHSR